MSSTRMEKFWDFVASLPSHKQGQAVNEITGMVPGMVPVHGSGRKKA